MGWKSVVWAGCLLPVLAGCGSVRNLTTGTRHPPAPSAYEYDPHNDASAAWAAVRAQHPRREFSDEFRDGFLAGHADYLTRGAEAQAPAVPPASYSRYKKYQTPEGEALVHDYYLGYQYGIDVAVSGRRRTGSDAPVVPGASRPPVMPAPGKPPADPIPAPRPVPGWNNIGDPKKKGSDDPVPGWNKSGDPKKKGSDNPPPLLAPPRSDFPEGVGQFVPPLPKPELPVIKPFNPDLSGGGKFVPLPVPANPDLLPVPSPPLPIPAPVTPIPVPSYKLDLPPPPVYVPAAPFLEPLPVIPFQYTPPATSPKK